MVTRYKLALKKKLLEVAQLWALVEDFTDKPEPTPEDIGSTGMIAFYQKSKEQIQHVLAGFTELEKLAKPVKPVAFEPKF